MSAFNVGETARIEREKAYRVFEKFAECFRLKGNGTDD